MPPRPTNTKRIESLIEQLTVAVIGQVKARARERLGVGRLETRPRRAKRTTSARVTPRVVCNAFSNGDTLRQTVVNMFYANTGREFTTAQVFAALAARGNGANSVGVTVAKLANTGELVRTTRGTYRANVA